MEDGAALRSPLGLRRAALPGGPHCSSPPSGTVGGVDPEPGTQGSLGAPSWTEGALSVSYLQAAHQPTWGTCPWLWPYPQASYGCSMEARQGPAGATRRGSAAWWRTALPQLHMQENRGWHVELDACLDQDAGPRGPGHILHPRGLKGQSLPTPSSQDLEPEGGPGPGVTAPAGEEDAAPVRRLLLWTGLAN